MKLNQKGFGVVEGLLAVIAVTLIVGVGYYVVDSNKDEKPVTSNTSKPEKTEQKEDKEQGVLKSEEELIVEAVKADGVETADGTKQEVTEVKVDEIAANNAKGTAGVKDDRGYMFIAQKRDGKWAVIYKGNELPGKDIGIKYHLPVDWVSKDY